MKKLLALILTVAMVMSMVAVPAAASGVNMKINLATATENGGLYGKAATEYANAMTTDTPQSGNAKAQFNVAGTSGYDFSDSKYVVFDLNVAPNGSATEIAYGPNAGLFTLKTTEFTSNQWNNVRIVVEDKTADELKELGTYQPATMYVNGVKVAEGAHEINSGDELADATKTNAYGKAFRFNILGPKSTMVGYVADLKLSASDVNEAPVMPVLAEGNGYTISGSNVTAQPGVTVADIKAANTGADIDVYADNSYSQKLADDAQLSMFNKIVVKGADNLYSYYDVLSGDMNVIVNITDGIVPAAWGGTKFTQECVAGIAGKALSDNVVLLTSITTDGAVSNANMFMQGKYTKSDKKYFVLQADINPVDIKRLSLKTTSHGGVSGNVTTGTDIEAGKWNKILMYVDYEADKCYTYANGVLVNENGISASFESSGIVRFTFEGALDEQVYLDDFLIYETDTAPDGIAATARPVLADGDGFSISDGMIQTVAGTTVADIAEANSGISIRAFENGSYAKQVDSSTVIASNMAIVAESVSGAMEYYTAGVDYSENVIFAATGDEGSPFPNVNNVAEGNEKLTASGIAGKEAADASMQIVQNGADTWFGTTWGKTTAGTDDEGTDATWDKSDYVGYLVMEASIYNTDNTTIALVTDGSRHITGNFASKLPKNQWSRVKIVINETGDSNDGKAIVYADGVAVTDWTAHNLGVIHTTKAPCNALRLQIKGGEQVAYVDDIRIYETGALRPEQSITITAPEGLAANDTQMAIVPGAAVTVQQLADANPDVTVKVFTDSTYAQQLGASDVIGSGNVAVFMAQSASAVEAGVAYCDMYKYYTIEALADQKTVISSASKPEKANELAAVEGGVFGNTSATIQKIEDVVDDATDIYFAHSYSGLSFGMKYLVYEVDFAPTATVKNAHFGANQHAQLSEIYAVGDDLKANQWHKMIMVYDIANDTSDTYINGKLVSDDFAGNYSEKYNNGINLRFITNISEQGTVSYIDTYKVYESATYPAVAEENVFADGYNSDMCAFADNTLGTLKLMNGTTVADVSANLDGAVVYTDDTYSALLDADDEVADGNMIVAQKGGNFTYYKVEVLADNSIVVFGDTYNAENNSMQPGALSIYAPVSDGGVVAAAQYDSDGSIIKLAMNDVAEGGVIALDFETEDVDDTTVKVILMASKASLKPLCKPYEIGVTRSYNILMLGNSFSMDVTCYMEEIAEAMGKKLNIAVLNKGGSAVSYHYVNREMPLASSDINFFLNDVHIGTSNLKTTLENYDWDYVIFQNWGSSKAFYTYSDSNYAANWASIVDLAKYVKENEPDAQQMIHETWSFEAGYNDFKDIATRDEIGADIRKLYDRCAQEAAAAIGQSEPLAKISSLDAFEAARAYVNADGVQMFETTYYKDGHLFAGYPNRATVPVGDGAQLLNPEDAAAGKVSLHRDGFHASAAARYLIALNGVEVMTGKSVYGNTFRPGKIALDSSAYYGGNEVTDLVNASSGVIYQEYDPLSEDVVAALQTVVDNMR